MLKKMLTVLLCASIVAGLASCGGGAKAPGLGGNEPAPESETGNAPQASDGKDELDILTVSRPYIQDLATNEFTLWIEEQTNVHVNWQTIPEKLQGGQEKLALLLSGGALPDVFMNCPFTPDMIAKYGVEEQLFLPLDDYIGKITPNLDKVLEKLEPQGVTMDIVRQLDGKIYALPIFDTCQHCEYSAKMWVYQPWLDAIGTGMPTTTEEFKNALIKIRDTDLNGNGEKDEIAFMGAETNGWQNRVDLFLMNSFIYYDYDQFGLYLDDDGKVMSAIDQPEFREGLRYLNDLYNEGLIYEGSLTQDYQTQVKINETPDNPMVGFNAGGWVGMFSNPGSDRAVNMRPVPPLTGPEGYRGALQVLQVPRDEYAVAYILSESCKNPEAAIRFADFMYTRESTLSVRGAGGLKSEGFWTEAEPGEKGFDGNPSIWKMLIPWNDTEPQNHTWLALGVWDYTDLRAAQSITEGMEMWSVEGNEWALYDMTTKLYQPAGIPGRSLPPLNYTVEEAQELSSVRTEIFNKSYFDTARFDFISGKKSLDADWDKYVEDLDKLGYGRMKEITQAAYDRQYKK